MKKVYKILKSAEKLRPKYDEKLKCPTHPEEKRTLICTLNECGIYLCTKCLATHSKAHSNTLTQFSLKDIDEFRIDYLLKLEETKHLLNILLDDYNYSLNAMKDQLNKCKEDIFRYVNKVFM